MKNNEEVIQLLTSTIKLLSAATDWEDKAFLKGLELGLEGEKRRNRFEGSEDNNLRKHLQSCAYDIFNVVIPYEHSAATFQSINSHKDYFTAYRSKMWEMYYALHEAANKLVVACFRHIAECIYDRADCILDDIIKCNRTIKRGEATDWMTHDTLIYQTEWCNVHDKYEKKEESKGYDY